jgi:hypothetical protein
MEFPSQKLLLNSSEAACIVEELRLVRMELSALTESTKHEKKREKLLGEWMPEHEIIELTGLSRNTLYNLWKAGKISKSSIKGKANYYKAGDFKQLLKENQYI